MRLDELARGEPAALPQVRAVRNLPDDVDRLMQLAAGESFPALERLVRDHRDGTNAFDRPGEGLFEARAEGVLIGIGGLNVDPHVSDGSTGRVRRFYVHPAHRRHGVGRLLLAVIEAAARTRFTRLRLRTVSADAAAFYRRCGFRTIDDPVATHVKAFGSAVSDDGWIRSYAPLIAAVRRDGEAVLELGCGGGRDTAELAAFGPLIALDRDAMRLHSCRERAPGAALIRADLAAGLPFRSAAFPVLVASLAIHYFRWDTTIALAREMRRCLQPGGLAIVRVNSTGDRHFGADSPHVIEPGLLQVDGHAKRFFDRASLLELFADWHVFAIEERSVLRYEQPKRLWEMLLTPPAGGGATGGWHES